MADILRPGFPEARLKIEGELATRKIRRRWDSGCAKVARKRPFGDIAKAKECVQLTGNKAGELSTSKESGGPAIRAGSGRLPAWKLQNFRDAHVGNFVNDGEVT